MHEFVIMPNHIHAIIELKALPEACSAKIAPGRNSIGAIIRGFKCVTMKRINQIWDTRGSWFGIGIIMSGLSERKRWIGFGDILRKIQRNGMHNFMGECANASYDLILFTFLPKLLTQALSSSESVTLRVIMTEPSFNGSNFCDLCHL